MPISQQYLKNTKFEDFDPNEPDKSEVLWAVYDGHRFRTFAQRGHAISSFNASGIGKLYEFEDGLWRERVVKLPPISRPEICSFCHASTMRYRQRYDRTLGKSVDDKTGPKYNHGKYEWVRYHGKLVDPLELVYCCDDCARQVRNA